jgi:hypothetical protein
VFTSSFIYISLYQTFNGYCGEYFVINCIAFIFSIFRDSLFAENHLIILERTLFDNMQKSYTIICTYFNKSTM